jgi:hypothetical protein
MATHSTEITHEIRRRTRFEVIKIRGRLVDTTAGYLDQSLASRKTDVCRTRYLMRDHVRHER